MVAARSGRSVRFLHKTSPSLALLRRPTLSLFRTRWCFEIPGGSRCIHNDPVTTTLDPDGLLPRCDLHRAWSLSLSLAPFASTTSTRDRERKELSLSVFAVYRTGTADSEFRHGQRRDSACFKPQGGQSCDECRWRSNGRGRVDLRELPEESATSPPGNFNTSEVIKSRKSYVWPRIIPLVNPTAETKGWRRLSVTSRGTHASGTRIRNPNGTSILGELNRGRAEN